MARSKIWHLYYHLIDVKLSHDQAAELIYKLGTIDAEMNKLEAQEIEKMKDKRK